MKRCIIVIFYILLLNNQSYCQTSLDDLDIVYKNDFEDNTIGDYSYSEFIGDWPNTGVGDGLDRVKVVQDVTDPINPTKSLQFNFPAGSLGPEEGGANWQYRFSKLDEIYISYDLMFMPGFEFQLGGKLPSVQGGDLPGYERPTGYDGFTGGLMFGQTGDIRFYIYYPDGLLDEGGTSFIWGVKSNFYDYLPSRAVVENASGVTVYADPGHYHNLTYRMVLNTLNNQGTGNYDGILEAYFDGQLVTQISHLLFRHTTDIGIDMMRMYSFFGGGDDAWRNPIDEWIRIDNVMLYTFKAGIDVPRGNSLSPTDRTINYWRKLSLINTVAPDSPSSLFSTEQTKSSVALRWNDNSNNEYGFKIFRSATLDGTFNEIYSTRANITSYTDKNLQAGTLYYYKICAYNDVGYSSYTDAVQTRTLDLSLPDAPSELAGNLSSNKTANLTWHDNSNNETGFEIERIGPNNTKQRFTINANTTSYSDLNMQVSSNYTYRIRAFNGDGYSSYSSILQISTPYIVPPKTPSSLMTTNYSDKSLTIEWNDNSDNETNFIITRSLDADPDDVVEIMVDADDTTYTDINLTPNTTYLYVVKAINDAGNSQNSNENVTSTISLAETKRIKDGLIAYYNFTYNTENIIYDLSGYKDPLNIRIPQPSSVKWDKINCLKIVSNTILPSQIPDNKIKYAVNNTGELTLECWIKPEEPSFTTNSRIISLEANDSEVAFALDQIYTNNDNNEKSLFYKVKLQTESTNKLGFPELISSEGITNLSMVHIAFVRDSTGHEILYLNGNQVKDGFRPGSFDSWNNKLYLRFGNENSLNYPWLGTLYSVAIFNKALTSKDIRYNYSVGIGDNFKNNGIKYSVAVYPNPVQDFVTVEINPLEQQDLAPKTIIKLLDIYGIEHYHQLVFNPYDQHIEKIDLKNYSDGLYILEVISGDQIQSSKIIVQ